jgi:transposase
MQTRGTQRTASPAVIAALRRLDSLAGVPEARRSALPPLSEGHADGVRQRVPLEGDERYGPRAEGARFPTETRKRDALARPIGAEGYALMEWLWQDASPRDLRALPAVGMLRPSWLQHSSRWPAPGLATRRWRSPDEQPPAALLIPSPDDVEARYRQKRETPWWAIRCMSGRPVMAGSPT